MARIKRLSHHFIGPPRKAKSPDTPDRDKIRLVHRKKRSPKTATPNKLSASKPPPTSRVTRATAAAEKRQRTPFKKPRKPANGYIPSDQAGDDYSLSTPEDERQDKQRLYDEDREESHIHFSASPTGLVSSGSRAPKLRRLNINGKLGPKMGSKFNGIDERDNITVQQQTTRVSPNVAAPAPDADHDTEDEEDPAGDLAELDRRESGPNAVETEQLEKTWRSAGKKPMRDGQQPQQDAEMIDRAEVEGMDEEPVDEGEVDPNDYNESEMELPLEPDEEIDLGKADIIELSSDDDGDDGAEATKKKKNKKSNPFAIDDRPWRIEGFSVELRKLQEDMYSKVTMQPIQGSWDLTEQYQLQKDMEMLRYLDDYPLPKWVIPKEQAEQAYFRLLERSRWRKLDIKIYGQQTMPEMIPGATPFARVQPMQPMQPMQHVPGNRDPRNMYYPPQQQPMMNGRPGSIPQQQMPYRPPSQGGPMGAPPGVLRSQPNAMPMQPSPTQGLPGYYQQQARPHGHHQQQQMGPPPQFGHAQHVGGPHGMPYQLSPGGHPHQQYVAHANVPMQHPQPGMVMPGMPHGMNGQTPGMHGHGRLNMDIPHVPPKPPGRKKKETPPPPTPPPPAPTPPYTKVDRPQARNPINKTGRKNMRKQAEAEQFPWHRDLDFKKERAEMSWDTSNYDDIILDQMREVRKNNMPIIARLDEEVAEKQRAARVKKKGGSALGRRRGPRRKDEEGLEGLSVPPPEAENAGEGPSKTSANGSAGTPPAANRKRGENIGGDPYYSGNFSFATEADRQKAVALDRKSPDEILEAAEQGKIDWDLCKEINICWNPGKKGTTQDLTQAVFRIYDTLITRKQMETKTLFTKRAAECIIDFCPDMLWRETLLRIASESGMGNKDIRDRFCFNGCYADKATVTKRIAAALGQKQTNNPSKKAAQAKKVEDWQEKVKKGEINRRRGPLPNIEAERYWEGEQEWHEQNKADFYNYVAFFGRRTSKRVGVGGKRRRADMDDDGAGASVEPEGAEKRARTEEGTSPGTSSELSEVQSVAGAEDHEDSDEEMEDDDEDAVSEQSDGVLDEIED